VSLFTGYGADSSGLSELMSPILEVLIRDFDRDVREAASFSLVSSEVGV